MRFCRNCGAPLDDDALFCRECGSKIEEQTVPQSSPVATEPSVLPQVQMTEMETETDTDTYIGVARDYTLYYIIAGVVAAVVLGIGGWWFYSHYKNDNNPLGVEAPKWEKFVKTNAKDVPLYKEADTSSPYLLYALMDDECAEGKTLWQGDKVPKNHTVESYSVEMNTVFPVLDESGEWYKVYIGTGEIREAYIEKRYCEEVKPEPITKEILAKVTNLDTERYKLVDKGEFANLYLEQMETEGGELVNVGVLTEGCIVIPEVCYFYPAKSDTTGVDMRNISDSPEYNVWHFISPESYWKATSYASEGIFDVSQLKESDIQKIVMALRPQGETASKVCYYFPTVATDRFIEFHYSFSPAAAVEVEEAEAVVTKYEEDDKKLMAEIDGIMINTGFSGFADLSVLLTADLDGDGSLECVVEELSGGTYIEPLYVVTYNADENKFVKSGNLDYMDEPTIEENGGATVILQRTGLRWKKYALENRKLKKVEDEIKSVGSVHKTIEMDNCYGNEETGDVKVTIDFNGDGLDDELTFHRGMSHVEGYGNWMQLVSVMLSDGSSYNIEVNAAKFSILNETTNGMPDIIGDNYLYRWNGSSYDSYGWDGKNLVKTEIIPWL